MHELSVCQALLAQLEQIARDRNADVVGVTVVIGPLSGVEPALLRQAFPLASAGTCAARAELTIHSPPVRVKCRQCRLEGAAAPNRMLCIHCGAWQVDVVGGDELLLGSVALRPLSERSAQRHSAGVLAGSPY